MSSVDTLSNYLLPVRVRIEYNPNPNSGLLERVCYLETRRGELLTNSVPFHWAQYMATKINGDYYRRTAPKQIVSDPIAVLRIDGLPFQKFDESKMVVRDKKGTLKLDDAPAYKESIAKAGLLGEDLFLNRWTQLPIVDPVNISCTYAVNSDKEFNIPLCNAWVLDLLYELGIIKSRGHKIVTAMDACSVRRVSSNPHTLVAIRRVERQTHGKL